jgi:hypothetical protein
MKSISCLIIAFVAIALIAPLPASSQGLLVPVDKVVVPGVSTVQYAGQTFVVNSPIVLYLEFRPVSANEFELTVKTDKSGSGGAMGGAQGEEETLQLVITWKNFNQDIYDDQPPLEPWTGLLDLEGGFAEK